MTDSSVGALVHGAWGLRHAKFHRNLTIGSLKNVEFVRPESAISSFRAVGMCHETVWRPIHPSGVLVHGARGLRHAKFHRNLTTGRFKNVEFTHAPGECDFELFC